MARALDAVGIVLFAAATTCLIAFFSDLHHPRWIFGGLLVVFLGGLLWWEVRVPHPFIDVRMLAGNRALSATYLRVAIMFLLNYCILYGFTQWLQEGRHLSASMAGYVMLPMSVAAAMISVPFSRSNKIRTCLIATGAAAVAGPACLLTFDSSTPVWVLIAATMFFAVLSGLGVIGNQAALYHQSPAETIGVAAGLLRTFTYIGAILSSSLVAVAYGDRASDVGLHGLALVLTGLGALLLVLTLSALGRLPRNNTPEEAQEPQRRRSRMLRRGTKRRGRRRWPVVRLYGRCRAQG